MLNNKATIDLIPGSQVIEDDDDNTYIVKIEKKIKENIASHFSSDEIKGIWNIFDLIKGLNKTKIVKQLEGPIYVNITLVVTYWDRIKKFGLRYNAIAYINLRGGDGDFSTKSTISCLNKCEGLPIKESSKEFLWKELPERENIKNQVNIINDSFNNIFSGKKKLLIGKFRYSLDNHDEHELEKLIGDRPS